MNSIILSVIFNLLSLNLNLLLVYGDSYRIAVPSHGSTTWFNLELDNSLTLSQTKIEIFNKMISIKKLTETDYDINKSNFGCYLVGDGYMEISKDENSEYLDKTISQVDNDPCNFQNFYDFKFKLQYV